jgi:hypothetical protein
MCCKEIRYKEVEIEDSEIDCLVKSNIDRKYPKGPKLPGASA